MSPKVCASVTGRNSNEVAEMIKEAEKEGADLVEIRYDYLLERPEPEDARRLTALPLIATSRLPSQGGLFQGEEEDRQRLYLEAAGSGFDFVDLETDTPHLRETMHHLAGRGAKIILSWHSSSPLMPNDIEAKLAEMTRLGPAVCKIVMTAKKMRDNLDCLEFVSKASETSSIVCFCMGSLGAVSRILSPLFGGAFTYASTMRGREAAPGQFTVSETKRIYQLLGV